MPIYEYECVQCGKIEEVLQKFSDPPLTTCQHCSGKLHKLISRNNFHLKGGGWYVTDYAGKPRTSGGDPPPKAEQKPAVSDTSEKSASPAS